MQLRNMTPATWLVGGVGEIGGGAVFEAPDDMARHLLACDGVFALASAEATTPAPADGSTDDEERS